MDGINHLHQHPPGRNRTLSPSNRDRFFFLQSLVAPGRKGKGRERWVSDRKSQNMHHGKTSKLHLDEHKPGQTQQTRE